MLAAGLAGIQEGLEPAPPLEDKASKGSTFSVDRCGIAGPLPINLGEAVDKFESSTLMKETLGEHIHSYLVETKRAEWMEYLRHVSQWELERYLAVL
jgi:glutamine synthetase